MYVKHREACKLRGKNKCDLKIGKRKNGGSKRRRSEGGMNTGRDGTRDLGG